VDPRGDVPLGAEACVTVPPMYIHPVRTHLENIIWIPLTSRQAPSNPHPAS
jgi:hypothetical protein